MGYTHYWTQPRDFTADEWARIRLDVLEIICTARLQHIRVGNWRGDKGTYPSYTTKHIAFNGVGDNACETFHIERKRTHPYPGGNLGWSFCKTRREPYDAAVTAVLIYLANVHQYEIASDGTYPEWIEGFNIATQALPNVKLFIPLPIVEPVT